MSIVYKQVMELGSIVTGKTPSTENSELWGGNIPFITPTDIKGFDCFYLQNTERTISNEGARKQKKTLLPENSICVTCIGSTIGKLCLTKVPSISNQQINTIIPNSDIDYRYLYYIIRLNIPYFQLIGGGCGAGTPILNKGKFERCKLLVEDSLPTQRKIASILSAYDSLIECNSKRIRLLEQMAENLYKEWFVRFRFPGHQSVKMINGLPEGWKYERLGNIANISTGKCNREDAEEEGEYPLFDRSQEIKRSSVWLKDCEAIIIPGEGTSFIPRYYIGKFNLHQRCYCVNPKTDGLGKYLFYMLMLNRAYFLSVATGATVPSLRYNNFASMKFILPTKDLYRRFDVVVTNIFNKIDNLKRQTALLTRQRDLLLPRLMSGKLDVKPE